MTDDLTLSLRTLPQVLSLDEAGIIAGSIPALAEATGIPFARWARNCHVISLALLRTGLFGRGRIARGFCRGVGSQHSWIILGDPAEYEAAS